MKQTPSGSIVENGQPIQRGAHPLGPLVWRERFARPLLGRASAAGLCLACVAVLGVARWLKPDPNGYGTHRRLGLAPCGFLVRTGYPCPTCGMTTSFALTVRGRIRAAIHAQPLAVLLAVLTATGAIAFGVMALSGKTWVINWYRVPPLRVVWAAGLAFILAWGVKILWGLLEGSLPASQG